MTTPNPGGLPELIAKWRKYADSPRYSNYFLGVLAGTRTCADELETALAQQEPVAWMDPDGSRVIPARVKEDASSAYRTATSGYTVPLYAAPVAERPAVNLSALHEVIDDMLCFSDADISPGWDEFDRWLEMLQRIGSQKESIR